ncbi:hypothetical protein HYV82_03580 [Candidatus Woesearchaeota archaeon]|nr:hypothetical protein [Candidatus Woesearchaeota archaeon]
MNQGKGMKPRTLAEALGIKGTPVMSNEQMQAYAWERKLADPGTQGVLLEEQVSGLRGIVIHNAKTTEEVRRVLRDEAKLSVVEYAPPKSSEPHFWVPATGYIHVVNTRGITRLLRDEALARILSYLLPNEVEIAISNYHGSRREANDRFEHFAYALVDDIFMHLDKAAVTKNGRINLLLGPYVSIDDALSTDGCEIAHSTDSDYLNYRIVLAGTSEGKEVVVNFDYIFADQAKDVLHKLYKGVAAEFSRQGISINVLHYGKVGVLDPATNVGDIIIPTGAFDEEKLQYAVRRGEPIPQQYALNNQIASNPDVRALFYRAVSGRINSGVTVNTNSVLEQTAERLRIDLGAGGNWLEMEWAVIASLSTGSHSTYPGTGSINHFLAGVGSDNPLRGQTLGETHYPREREAEVAKAMIRIIQHMPELGL